jgi:F0F1-type ATP synthase epsilon subunit
MFELILVCDERKVFEGPVSEVIVATSEGTAAILENHQPYMAKISEQVSYVSSDGSRRVLDISEGFVYTNGAQCHVVVDVVYQTAAIKNRPLP